MKFQALLVISMTILAFAMNSSAQVPTHTPPIQVSTLQQLAQAATQSNQNITMPPGIYRMSDYLTDAVASEVRKEYTGGRSPVWMLRFSGNNNRFDMRGVTLEIETSLYRKLPGGYMRCVFVTGNNNTFDGLTIRNAGANVGSNGNIMSVWGENNTVENVTLHVFGSFPHGYGDLLGKGGPNIVRPLQKQSGMMIGGTGNTVRRCKVFSRAFGHCFYIQTAKKARIEDCYAEGEMRSTNDMLRDTGGPAFDLHFRSVYENRDGRYLITPGYTKSLSEDGFRTYGGVSQTTILNCTAVNTRAGFEIGGSDDDNDKTIVENCVATGCERGYLLGSNVVVRNSRGDVTYGPLLYLRPSRNSDVELELTGKGSDSTVHALATIAGEGHRVRLFTQSYNAQVLNIPLMLGFDMPRHAEMATPILPAPTSNVTLINEIPHLRVITSEQVKDGSIQTPGKVITDVETRRAP
jgi:hypothetical protein